ncbi:Luciferase-like, subgroup [Pseudopedobacter saltans DSM 12145]|uniref:Luciferase-like, subgroup n=1 Tax=Pseudopedobacter saltans (strain ATCC 51119 / DSM 12145 / JCM 21818 / CCUG 39354 / LMG 10337 / NBRC 100064 / NCIMB 13643) TaxID=762903 RepID=F0SD34_PSESL|nr:LLM class flavin-dependent oxidoreductase [Pseudopedobacter saltans]ADY51791.1 Luciferase-like, subgroup [Pseudopedobacter saltans DSM 12145]
MELGIGMFGDVSKNKTTGKHSSPHQRIKEIIEEIKLADQVGLDVFGMGEHHREDYAVSSPEMILAAAAAVTKKIKLASAVTVLSSSDPVKVYEDFATLDLLSDGRAEIMVGRGSFIESFPLYGYHLSDYNVLFEEKLDLLLNINKNEVINWKGTVRAPLTNQRIFPRALNNGLNIWIAVGGTPESVIRAARLGLPLIIAIIGGYPYQFQPLVRLYKEEYQKYGHDVSKMQIGIHSHTFVGENSEQTADSYYPYYADQMDRIGRDRGWPPFRKEQFEGGRKKEGALFIGDPSEVADKILYMHELFGLTRFVAHIDVGGPEHKDIMKAIELFGSKVAPEVKKHLKK